MPDVGVKTTDAKNAKKAHDAVVAKKAGGMLISLIFHSLLNLYVWK